MRRSLRSSAQALLVLVVAGTACEVSSEGPRDRPAADAAVMAHDESESIAHGMRQSVTTVLQSGAQAVTGMPALYTPDAVLSDESETTYAGREQIARAFSQGLPPGATIDIRATSRPVGSGDLVVDMGTYRVTMPNPQGGPDIAMNGRYLVVLQRTEDDSWKIVRQITDVVGTGGALVDGPPAPVDSVAADSAAP